MTWLYALGLIVLVIAVLILLTPARAIVAREIARIRRGGAPPASSGVTIIEPDGQEYEVPGERARPALAARIGAMSGARRWAASAALVALALLAVWQLYRLVLAPQPEHFVVLVAPFHEPNSDVTQTGREVAAALAGKLNDSDGLVVARTVDQAPADATAALDLLDREGGDALIWGEVTPGGMIDRESLTPLLVYRPNGPFAPYGWEGYAGRFEMPSAYVLSSAPINGAVVLPQLMDALANYGAGRVDSAFDTLGSLMDSYPAVAPALPRVIRGNVLWARGEFATAAGEYRRAIGSLAQAKGQQAAMLYNNLGAILQDSGDDSQAQVAFNQAIGALGGEDLGALRYNLGLQAMRASNWDGAITALNIARSPNLLPSATPSAPLLLALADVYRLSGRFADARQTLDTATQQVPFAAIATTPELQNLTRSRLDASVETERALLSLAEATGARGLLPWEADSPTLPVRVLNDARRDLSQAVDDTQVLTQRWSRLAVSKDAASETSAGQIATRHNQRAQELLRARQRWVAGVDIEIERAQGVKEPRGLGAVWAAIVGDRSPMGLARSALGDLTRTQPNDVASILLLGRSYVLSGDFAKARDYYNQAAELAPGRPEPVYGQALAELGNDQLRDNRVAARPFLQRAIQIDPAFFPAREKLAKIAEEDADWPTAIEQRRWLYQNRPSDEHRNDALALAETLRLSGPAGFAEAERLLIPLANQNDTDALIALSRLYEDRGDRQAARDMLARAKASAPRDPKPSYEYAQLLKRQGDQGGAEAEYNHALQLNAVYVPARLGLGGLYAEQGKLPQASEQYRKALDAGANDPAQLKEIGNVLLADRQFDQAADAYNRAQSSAEAAKDADLHHGLAQAYLGLNRLDQAEKEEQTALELRDNVYPEAQIGLGDIALQRGKIDQAEQQYSAALSQNAKLAGGHVGLGRVAAARGNWSVAEAHFRDALAIDPKLADAHLARGDALLKIDQPQPAIDEYAAAIKLKANYPEAYLGLAKAQLATGRADLAKDNLDAAIKLRQSFPEAYLQLGLIAEQQGRTADAIDAYSRSIDTGSTVAEPYYRRALLYMAQQQLDSATKDLEKAVGIQSNFPEAHYWLGRAYLAQGRPRPARDQLTQAIEQRGGDYPDALFYQGQAEEQLGQRTDAVASYQAALNQNDGGEWAGEARSALDRLR